VELLSKEEYLELIQKLDLLIGNEAEELEKLRAIAEKITQENDGMPHASGTSDKVGNLAVKIVMKQQELGETICLCVELRSEIVGEIGKLNTDEYDVLYKHYVLNMNIKKIAAIRRKSISWVKEIRRLGIEHIEIKQSDVLNKILQKSFFQNVQK
jgi:hypothetical protein